MDEQYVTHIVLRQYRTSSSYSERETAAASHLGIGAIRHLRALGLIEGEETGGEPRYSEEEVIQLRQIRRLQHDLGVNLAGVEVILRLLKHLEAVRQELEQERNQAAGRDPCTRMKGAERSTHTGDLILPDLPVIPPTGTKISLPYRHLEYFIEGNTITTLTADFSPNALEEILAQMRMVLPW